MRVHFNDPVPVTEDPEITYGTNPVQKIILPNDTPSNLEFFQKDLEEKFLRHTNFDSTSDSVWTQIKDRDDERSSNWCFFIKLERFVVKGLYTFIPTTLYCNSLQSFH